MALADEAGMTLLVAVKGQVAFGSEPFKDFAQNFLLGLVSGGNPQEMSSWRITSDCFRTEL